MTLRAAVRDAAADLARAGVETPDVDAEWLVAHVAGTTRSAVRAAPNLVLTPTQELELAALVERRCRREPLAYVLGEWGFRGLELKLDRRALVPRPETELLVERCLVHLRAIERPRVLDVGVGSGAIAIALADEHPGATIVAFDASPDAVALARENADAAGVAHRVDLSVTDLVWGQSPDTAAGDHASRGQVWGQSADTFDLVVSNPPYVPEGDVERLQPEVRDWEPREALVDRGQTGVIARGACEVLKPAGWLVLETHPPAAGRLRGELESLGYTEVSVTRDLAGRERFVEGRWPG